MRSSGLPAILAVSFWYMRGVTGMSSGTSCWRGLCGHGLRRGAELAALAFRLKFADREIADAERVSKGRGDVFEFDDAAGFWFLVDAVERGHAEMFQSMRPRTRWRRA